MLIVGSLRMDRFVVTQRLPICEKEPRGLFAGYVRTFFEIQPEVWGIEVLAREVIRVAERGTGI